MAAVHDRLRVRGFCATVCLLAGTVVAGPDFGTDGKLLTAAVVEEDAGRTEQAAVLYERFIARYDGIPGAYYYLGNLYYDAGRVDEAVQAYGRARAACPG